ncbi:DUF6913 domain-containing protein [Myroides odoratimimus]|uniref:DUF6913 domain-containing protein n=1 Tax=Myroides odoratimimus TaxID=76832 RepID=UPI002577F791|nr:hypothetical protein [Myroides odoratimimus]MDM1529383.1 hypothetical protein [Myroides odoratimimus]
MWFNTLKKRSLQKVVEKSTLKAVPVDFKYDFREIGIVVDKAEAKVIPDLIRNLEKRGIPSAKIHFLVYAKDSKKNNEEHLFGMNEFTLTGSTENKEVLEFIEKKCDLLISYYTNQTLPLLWVTSKSNAIFKVGVSSENTQLNHFSLALERLDVDNFVDNLFKYINVFKN